MKRSHLFPILSVFSIIILFALLSATAIPISPLMITVVVVSILAAQIVYHTHQSTITTSKVFELCLMAFMVQIVALGFL